MNSLQSITDAWGKWLAKKKGTSCDFTASTNYSSHSELKDYHQYQCSVTLLDITYDGNSPPTGGADVAYELWYDNASDLRQTENFSYTSTTEQEFYWSITEGLSIGVTVGGEVGTPDVASVSGEVTVELSLSSTQGASHKEDQTWKVDTPVQVPAQASLKCDMVVNAQSYNINYTQSVLIKGDVAIWFKDKVAMYGNDDKHYLWFIPISEVFDDVIDNGLTSTSGYKIVSGGVQATAKGAFTGSQGVSVGVTTTQYPLRSSASAAQFQPVSSDKIYSATPATQSAEPEPVTMVAQPVPGGACV